MHELSIADAMAQLVRRHITSRDRVLCVHMKAGPLRGIDPDTMQMAWRATCADTELQGSTLQLEISPWLLRCPLCSREWEAPSVGEACTCGCTEPHFGRCDDLLLTAIDVDDVEETEGTNP